MRIPFCLLFASLAAFAQLPEAQLISRVQPDYSPEARAANLQGIVTAYLEIDPEGKVENVQVIQGLGLGLDERAVEAVQHWQFKPAGQPLRTARSAEIRFQLPSAGPWRIRHTAYAVVREDRYRSETVVKPSLAAYTRPDAAACPAGNTLVTVGMHVGKDGATTARRILDAPDDATGKAVLAAAETWKFTPASGSNKPRAAEATLLLECNAGARPEPATASRIGGSVSPPALASKVEPEYSEEARKSKYQGSVTLYVEVDPAGIATNMKISRMLGEGLDVKAMEAVKQWRFKPGMRNGTPVTVIANIEVSFRLM